MPRFFFDLHTPEGLESDKLGLLFDTLDDAYLNANQAALEITIDLLSERRDVSRYRFEIRDESGAVMTDIPFTEVLNIGRPSKPCGVAEVHDRLRASLARSRKLRKDLADALAKARESALHGLQLAEIDWAIDKTPK